MSNFGNPPSLFSDFPTRRESLRNGARITGIESRIEGEIVRIRDRECQRAEFLEFRYSAIVERNGRTRAAIDRSTSADVSPIRDHAPLLNYVYDATVRE